ncbi:hypothetical protein Chor_009350 [Crotalus horridus]
MYTIEVRAVTKSNVYGDTMTISVITAPNSPEKITVESYSPYYLSIAWNPPKDPNATDYLYRISWWREDGTQVGNYSILGFNYTICSLKPGLVYLVRVISEFSEILSEATKLWTLTSPLSPTHFHIQMINQTTAHFAWVNPNSPFSAIRLQWSPSDGSRGNETYPKPLNQAVLHGLTPSTNYSFTLFSTAGNGSLSRDSIGLQQHEATKPEQVSDLICLPLQDSWSLKLSWTCPASPVSKIVVLVSDKAWKNEPNCSESVVIEELQPAKVYQIKIKTFWYNQYAVSDTVECSINTTDASEEQNPDVGLSGVLGAVPVSAFPRHCYEKLSDSAFGFAVEYQCGLHWLDSTLPMVSSSEPPQNQRNWNRSSNYVLQILTGMSHRRTSKLLSKEDDHARVQLTLKPEDPYSDYINASYMPVKCEHYWPLDYTPCTYDDITVSVITETILPDWSVRDFCIKQVSD